EVPGPVLLAGQVRAPWRIAVGAVVDRAASARTVGGGHGLEEVRAAYRSVKSHRGVRRDPAVERALLLPHPGAVAGISVFDHADTVGLDLLDRLGGGPWPGPDVGRAVRMQVVDVEVLEVLHQQPAGRAGVVARSARAQAIPAQRVAVIADALGETGVGAVVRISGHASGDRIAETGHHRDGITG